MEIFVCGLGLGLVLSFALFIQRVWNLEDRIEEYKLAIRHYKRTCRTYEQMLRQYEKSAIDAVYDRKTNDILHK